MNWPNRLTLIRLLVIPCLIIAIIYRTKESVFLAYLPLFLFAFASLTDAVDGYLARRYNLKTELGTFLDPLADKTLILSTFLCLHFSSTYTIKMPVWVLIIIASRDFIIVAWLIVSYMNHLDIIINPNFLGKTTTFFQMLTILSLLFEWQHSAFIWYVTLIFTISSAANYIWRETRKLQDIKI